MVSFRTDRRTERHRSPEPQGRNRASTIRDLAGNEVSENMLLIPLWLHHRIPFGSDQGTGGELMVNRATTCPC